MLLLRYKLSKNFWGLTLALVGIGVLLPSLGLAGVTDSIAEVLANIIWWVWLTPFMFFLQAELFLLPVVASYNNFTSVNGVVIGWTVLRDLANMLFVLVLLVIAFSTIMGIERFGYRQLLKRLIIMAILINFSMTIVGLAIDLSQVVMLTFVQAIRNVAVGNIAVAFGIDNIFSLGGISSFTNIANYIVALILGGVMIMIVTVVIGVFLFMLTMRIVKIWILLVVSPLAFLAYTFPRTQQYYNKWVDDLTSTLISGPTLVFFLWLSFTIVGRGDVYEGFISESEGGQQVGEDISGGASKSNLTNFIIALSMLIGGLQITSQVGGSVAGVASKGSAMIKRGADKRLRRVQSAGVAVARPALQARGAMRTNLGTRLRSSRLANINLGRITQSGYGVGRVSRGLQGGIRAIADRSGRNIEQAGLRDRGTANVLSDRQVAELEQETANLTQEQQEQYFQSKQGSVLGQRFEGTFKPQANIAGARARARRGYSEAEITNGDVERDLEILRGGGKGDQESITKIQSRYAVAADATDLRERASEQGTEKVLSMLNFTGAGRPQLTEGTVAALELLMNESAKTQRSIYAKMNQTQQRGLVAALAHYNPTDPMMDPNNPTQVNVNGDAFRHQALVAQASPAQAAQHYSANFNPNSNNQVQRDQARNYVEQLSRRVSGEGLAKLDMQVPAQAQFFNDMVGHFSPKQVEDVMREGTTVHVQNTVQQQVQQGNVQLMLDGKGRQYVKDTDIRAGVQRARQDFQRNNPNASAAELQAVREDLAIANLDKAHVIYQDAQGNLDQQGLTDLANNRLKKAQVVKLDKPTLTQIRGGLSADMQRILRDEEGIT